MNDDIRMIYDYYKEKKKKNNTNKYKYLGIGILLLLLIVIIINIYLKIIQLDEIGGFSSVYLINLRYKIIFACISFVIIFIASLITNIFIKKNVNLYFKENDLSPKKFSIIWVSLSLALVGAYLTKDAFYQNALEFLNSVKFGTYDPIFGTDVGYYVFQRPFLMSIYSFFSGFWIFMIIYTFISYLLRLFSGSLMDSGQLSKLSLKSLKIRTVLRHNLINIAIFFIIKTFSYKFLKEGVLFSTFNNELKGGGFVDINVWMPYYKIIPYVLGIITLVAFFFIWKEMLRKGSLYNRSISSYMVCCYDFSYVYKFVYCKSK